MIQTTQASFSKKAIAFTLSTPVQSGLYLSLAAVSLWSVYFTTYPPIHDAVHSSRQDTLIICCHLASNCYTIRWRSLSFGYLRVIM